jgi:hypothetical protein
MSPHLLLLPILLATACMEPAVFEAGEILPEFLLEDANQASATHGELLGPSGFRGRASAWYFGHAS